MDEQAHRQLVSLLRESGGWNDVADELDRLRAEVDRLRSVAFKSESRCNDLERYVDAVSCLDQIGQMVGFGQSDWGPDDRQRLVREVREALESERELRKKFDLTAFHEGYHSRPTIRQADNPHRYGTPQYKSWLAGYLANGAQGELMRLRELRENNLAFQEQMGARIDELSDERNAMLKAVQAFLSIDDRGEDADECIRRIAEAKKTARSILGLDGGPVLGSTVSEDR